MLVVFVSCGFGLLVAGFAGLVGFRFGCGRLDWLGVGGLRTFDLELFWRVDII